MWRLLYGLAPKDPLVLEMTQEEIVHDLVTRLYHEHEKRKGWDPKGADADEQRRDQDMAAGYRELEKDYTEGEMAARVKQFEATRAEETKQGPGRRVTGLRISHGKMSAGKVSSV